MIANNTFLKIWEETVVPNFSYYKEICIHRPRKTMKNLTSGIVVLAGIRTGNLSEKKNKGINA
jgi:hypothetical protein